MHQAQIATWATPRTLHPISLPAATSEQTQILVLAIGIHRIVRSRAQGTHYSATTLPHTPGIASLGLDREIVIAEKVEETDFGDLNDVDVVLDYVYGPLAIHLFKSLKTPKPVQYVHIGSLSGPEIAIPGEVLRSKDLKRIWAGCLENEGLYEDDTGAVECCAQYAGAGCGSGEV